MIFMVNEGFPRQFGTAFDWMLELFSELILNVYVNQLVEATIKNDVESRIPNLELREALARGSNGAGQASHALLDPKGVGGSTPTSFEGGQIVLQVCTGLICRWSVAQ